MQDKESEGLGLASGPMGDNVTWLERILELLESGGDGNESVEDLVHVWKAWVGG